MEITALYPATCSECSKEYSIPFKKCEVLKPLLRCYTYLLAGIAWLIRICNNIWVLSRFASPIACCAWHDLTLYQLRKVLLKTPLQNLRLNWKSISWNRVKRTLIWTPERTKIRYSKFILQNSLMLIQARYNRITTWHTNLVISVESKKLEINVHTTLKVRN